MTLRMIVLGLLMLAVADVRAEMPSAEVLLGVATDFEARQVVFEVASSGCTRKEDFRVGLREGVLTLMRENPDFCKRMPFREQIVFTLDELGLSPHQPFALGNRLIVNEHLTRP